ncbi:restriction endonuclease subunit S [Pseudomonas sp. B21-048]|uniref:restriction endonuclease subunit S n=1 Tax=Pseudomonas sp. B21-048 TaxID=2895490 RepID=UPI00215F9D34|nr:restriction endonuclease subunit S [Pseudomonas sp. B21-048]UVK99482.1 restriction endonuclease subunit S [Pseudomonas sp. B21-048]
MSELSFAPLTKFADITMGQSPGVELCNTDGKGLPFLQGCAEFGASNPQASVYCAPPLRTAKAGSVLISVRAPVGTMNYADQDYCIGRGLGAFKAKPGLSNTVFLKHAVEHRSNYLHRRSQGSTFAAVSTGDVQNIPIPMFPFNKQNKIAAIFKGMDTSIEKTEALIAKYQQIKAGLMLDLFTRGLLPNGQLRPSYDQAPELYQETAIGWIPQDWHFTTCSKVCEKIIDCKNRTPPETPDGFPVIRTPNVRNGVFVDKDLVFTDEHSYFVWTMRGKPQVGDILITREAPVGEVCMIPERHPSACLGQRMMLYRPNQELIAAQYFLYALQSRQIQNRLDLISGGSTVGHVRVGDIRDLWMFMPKSPQEQNQIASALDAISEKLNCELSQLCKLRQQRIGLMDDLLTGKVLVRVDALEATYA